MAFLGIEIGSSIESNVSDYMGEHPAPASWDNKTRADLDTEIKNRASDCGNFCHDKNSLHTRNRAVPICEQAIRKQFAGIIDKVQQRTATEETALKSAALQGNSQTYAVVAIVLLVLVAIVIILRS